MIDYTDPEYKNTVKHRPTLLWGKVLMLGLGEGEMIEYILKHLAVEKLVVVEHEQEVIDGEGVELSTRFEMVLDDAYAYHANHADEFDFILQDLFTTDLGKEHWIKMPLGVQLRQLEPKETEPWPM